VGVKGAQDDIERCPVRDTMLGQHGSHLIAVAVAPGARIET
jgi:hypothetical protein